MRQSEKEFIEAVVNAVSLVFGNDPKEKTRQRRFSMSRNCCYSLIRENTDLGLTTIAHALNVCNHATVLNGLQNHERDLKTNFKNYANMYSDVRKLLHERLDPKISEIWYKKAFKIFTNETNEIELTKENVSAFAKFVLTTKYK